MKTVNRNKVNEAIRMNQKYFRTKDCDFLDKMNKAEKEAFKEDYLWISRILNGITGKDHAYNKSYDLYYRVLEALGFTWEGEEK